MNGEPGRRWALVLAAGEGSRLKALTTDASGRAIPKQFCSLRGEGSLLEETLHRAARLSAPERVVTIVASHHREWWEGELAGLPGENVVVQPQNRGTATGVLLPLLSIVERDPDARVAFFPSDHHVADEDVLVQAVECAFREVERRPDVVILLGITPDESDAEFGWIVPAMTGGSGARPVRYFVEKPPASVAQELHELGGLWNTFIFVGAAAAVLALYERRLPSLLAGMDVARGGWETTDEREAAVARFYDRSRTFDFSRDVLSGAEESLRVLPVPACGWDDLGTPDRVVRCLARHPEPVSRSPWVDPPTVGRVVLAEAGAGLR